MKDKEKTKAQLIAELEELRARLAELDSLEAARLPDRQEQADKRTEEALRKRTEQVIHHQTALLELAKQNSSEFESALKRITAVDSKTLGVERVSVWLFNEDRSEIICEDLYKLSENFHEKGLRLQAKQYPRYFRALEESRTIAANDARTDPRTNEFTEGYLKPFGITSMMDVPIWLHGKVIGVVCHEHTGPKREWTLEEQDFVVSIADMVSLALEASERRQVEEALRESGRFLSNIFTSIQDGLSILDKEMNIIRVNPTIEQWYSHAMPLVGKKCYQAYHERSERCKVCPSHRTLETGEAAYEVVPKRGPGGVVVGWLDLYSFPLVDMATGQTKGVIEYVRDITERKRLEEQLLQSQKIEAVGRLADGVAHDFSNLLTSIIGYAEMLEMKLPPEDPIHSHIKQILKAADHATTLIQQLLTFSRKAMIQPIVLNLNHVIENSKSMLQRMLGEDIVFEFIPGKDLESVKADPSQIEQIIMNLAVNSRDAMPKGGKLIIETNNVELDEEYVKKYPYAKPGRYVLLSVSDTGCGMDAETLSCIFEPFFTTKEKSTGLGLSTVYGIVKQSGGYINVYSEVGKGTTVKIYLP